MSHPTIICALMCTIISDYSNIVLYPVQEGKERLKTGDVDLTFYKSFPCFQTCNAGYGSLYHGYHGQLQACQGDEPHGQLRDEHGLLPGGDHPDLQAADCKGEKPARQAKWRDIQAELTQEGTCQEHSDLSLILHQGRSVISSFQAGRGGAHQSQGHLEPALPPPSQGGGT